MAVGTYGFSSVTGHWIAGDDPDNVTPVPLRRTVNVLDEIAKRFISYIQKCLSSDYEVSKFVTSYGITVDHMASRIVSMCFVLQ